MMRAFLLVSLVLAALLTQIGAATLQDEAPPPGGIAGGDNARFGPVEVWIDTGPRPLAAYQLEVSVARGAVKIVGIEGGAHPLFSAPPYYDPAAMQQERVIIAAFSTAGAESLPTARTRIATIHVQISGEIAPEFETILSVAADAAGKAVPANITLVQRNQP